MPLYKVWNVSRTLRKAVVDMAYDEFVEKGEWFDLVKASFRFVRILKKLNLFLQKINRFYQVKSYLMFDICSNR